MVVAAVADLVVISSMATTVGAAVVAIVVLAAAVVLGGNSRRSSRVNIRSRRIFCDRTSVGLTVNGEEGGESRRRMSRSSRL